MFWRGRFRGNRQRALQRRAIHPSRTTSQNDNIAAEPRRLHWPNDDTGPIILFDRRPSDQTTSSTSSASMYERIRNIFDLSWHRGIRQLMGISEHSSSTSLNNNGLQQAADNGTCDDDLHSSSISTHLSSPLDQRSPSDHCISITTDGADSDNPTLSSQRIDDTSYCVSSSDDESIRSSESIKTASLRRVQFPHADPILYATLDSCYSSASDHPSSASAISSLQVCRDRRPYHCESAPAILTTKCTPCRPNANTITMVVSISDHDNNNTSSQSTALVGKFQNVVSSCLLPLGSYLHDDLPLGGPYLCDDQAHVSMSWLSLASDSSADADETQGLKEEMRRCARSAANFLSFFQLLWQSPTINRFTTERMMDEFLLDYRTLVIREQQLIRDRDNDGHDHQWHD